MLTDELLEETRDLIMESLATWQPSKSDGVTIYNKKTSRMAFNSNAEGEDSAKRRDTISATATRRKGTSKLNCSEDVFEHLRVARTINTLPSHFAKWLLYRYGEAPQTELLPGLVEIVMSELPNLPAQARSKSKVETMAAQILLNQREFADLQAKGLFEAIGVSKQVYFRRYATHSSAISAQLNALDCNALEAFFVAHNSDLSLDHASKNKNNSNMSHFSLQKGDSLS
ncbi:hypothetical protein K6O87_004117 [Vibrio vulnificus]|nr:hypothetical protein [Vibrio vulnificus]